METCVVDHATSAIPMQRMVFHGGSLCGVDEHMPLAHHIGILLIHLLGGHLLQEEDYLHMATILLACLACALSMVHRAKIHAAVHSYGWINHEGMTLQACTLKYDSNQESQMRLQPRCSRRLTESRKWSLQQGKREIVCRPAPCSSVSPPPHALCLPSTISGATSPLHQPHKHCRLYSFSPRGTPIGRPDS